MAGAPEIEGLQSFLQVAGFSNVSVEIKEESRDVIKQWLPGTSDEHSMNILNFFVVSI